MKSTNRSQKWLRFSAIVLTAAAAWLVGLPWLAATAPMDEYLRWLDEHKIDPSAMFYTELEAMDPILDKVDQRQRSQ